MILIVFLLCFVIFFIFTSSVWELTHNRNWKLKTWHQFKKKNIRALNLTTIDSSPFSHTIWRNLIHTREWLRCCSVSCVIGSWWNRCTVRGRFWLVELDQITEDANQKKGELEWHESRIRKTQIRMTWMTQIEDVNQKDTNQDDTNQEDSNYEDAD